MLTIRSLRPPKVYRNKKCSLVSISACVLLRLHCTTKGQLMDSHRRVASEFLDSALPPKYLANIAIRNINNLIAQCYSKLGYITGIFVVTRVKNNDKRSGKTVETTFNW